MISVDQAVAAILESAERLDSEKIPLDQIVGRVAATDVIARLTQPPFPASAMDGYAVRFDDAILGARLRVVGEAPAGAPFGGIVKSREAVRIFTGAQAPNGADHVVIQEDVKRFGDEITIDKLQTRPRNIRPAGIDFSAGDILAKAGDEFHEVHGALFAAANIVRAAVVRKPIVAIFSSGDELAEPGVDLNQGQIINSNHYALTALVSRWGGAANYIGCAVDLEKKISEFFESASDADIIIPVGGASVGDHDYVKSAFCASGGKIVFENIAVKPGKPTWFGKLGRARVIGLPGNPASAIVTAALFVQPLVRLLAGKDCIEGAPCALAKLSTSLEENGGRESYLRGTVTFDKAGVAHVTPAGNQDSSLLLPFAAANVLIKREIRAPAATVGDLVEIIGLR